MRILVLTGDCLARSYAQRLSDFSKKYGLPSQAKTPAIGSNARDNPKKKSFMSAGLNGQNNMPGLFYSGRHNLGYVSYLTHLRPTVKDSPRKIVAGWQPAPQPGRTRRDGVLFDAVLTG